MSSTTAYLPDEDKRPRAMSARTDRGGRLMATAAAARYTGWPYATLRDYAKKGLIPCIVAPGSKRMFFEKKDLDKAIEAWKRR